MFGYIKPFKPELKIREYDAYKAVYCTLCKQLRKDYGVLARFTLNFDYTFLAMIRMSAKQSSASVCKGKCPFNPFAKCNHIICQDDSLSFSTAVAICMLYYKCKDTLQDEGLLHRFLIGMTYPVWGSWHRKAVRRYPEIEIIISDFYEQQVSAETNNAQGLDVFCHPTAIVLARLFSHEFEGSLQKSLYAIGYNIGKWIYLTDALDDYKKDLKKGRFNPYEIRLGREVTPVQVTDFALLQLNICIDEACMAYEKMPHKNFHPILHNILTLGLEQIQNEVIMKVKNDE